MEGNNGGDGGCALIAAPVLWRRDGNKFAKKTRCDNTADTEALFQSRAVSRFRNIERVARRKLPQIHAATELASLRIPPGNPLEARKADRKGQHSIRIDDQWRVCIVWKTDGAYRFDIVD